MTHPRRTPMAVVAIGAVTAAVLVGRAAGLGVTVMAIALLAVTVRPREAWAIVFWLGAAALAAVATVRAAGWIVWPSLLAAGALGSLAAAGVPEPHGSAHRVTAPYQALRTADGHITVGGNNQKLWQRLCEAIGRPELAEDARFASNDDRMANRPELVRELESALAARSTDEWVSVLIEAGVPCGPIHDYRQVFEDEHTQAREMEVQVDGVRMLGIPVKMSDTPGAIRRTAPEVGEHTAEVLREAGFSDAEIEAL